MNWVLTLIVSCKNCGKSIYRTPSQISKSKTGNFFCCRKCASNYIHSRNNNSISINDYREKALMYYGNQCEICGDNEDVRLLDVHHIDGNRKNNDITNLIVLCVRCHAKITRGICRLENRIMIYNDDIDYNIDTSQRFEYNDILCFDKDDNFIDIFYGIEDVIDWLKTLCSSPNKKYIFDCINGDRRSAYGFKFRTLE